MNIEEQKIIEQANSYVKKYAKILIKKFADPEKYKPDPTSVSIFMAGSPGAGKTEFSKGLLSAIFGDQSERFIVRIDADEIKNEIPGYTGTNAYLFQSAASILVDKIHDHVISKNQNFILDGTLSNFKRAEKNIQRSLNKRGHAFVFYIYQDPIIAWDFTKRREEKEGRRIPKDAFIQHFFNAKETVNNLKKYFGKQITIYLIEKNFQQEIVTIKENIDMIDNYIKFKYTKNTLNEVLKNL